MTGIFSPEPLRREVVVPEADQPLSGLRPYVRPGQALGYRQRLERANAWPPPKKVRQGPTLTPFLVVPAFEGDTGNDSHLREVPPLPPGSPRTFNAFLGVRFANLGDEYSFVCDVHNLGPMASYGGIAVFYVGQFPLTSSGARGQPTWTPFGYAGFTVMPGTSISIQCPNKWRPATSSDVEHGGILVQAYDLLVDPMTSPYNPYQDRHVGIREFVPPIVLT